MDFGKRSGKMYHSCTVLFRRWLTNIVFRMRLQQRDPLFHNLSRSEIREIFLGPQPFQRHHWPITVRTEQPFQSESLGQNICAGWFHGRRYWPGARGGGLERTGVADLGSMPDARRLINGSVGSLGIRVISAFALTNRSTSRVANTPFKTSASWPISRRACPIICGRTDRAFANSVAACRSAELVMTSTWLVPACRIAEVTWRSRFTTFCSIWRIIRLS